MNLQKHIWEGWTVQSFFIDELEASQSIMHGQSITNKFTSKERKKNGVWIINHIIKKYIPEVVTYFADK
jgi:hypothetical protein